MRRFVTLLLCVVAAVATMRAATTVSLSGASGHPGDEVTVSVAMSGDDAVTALEVVIPLDEALSYVDGSCSLATDRDNGHQLTAAQVGQELRIYAYSVALNPFNGTEGELLSFKLLLSQTTGSFTLTPSVVLSDAAGDEIASTTSSGTVTILSPAISVSAASIDFGHIAIRSTYSRSFTLRNTGNEALTVSQIVCGDKTLSVTPSSCVIAAGGSQSVTVSYAPVTRGDFSSTVTILSDAVNGAKQTVTIAADPYSVNELRVQSASGVSGGTATVALTMNNMEPIVAAQMSFTLPSGLSYVDGSVALGDRSVNHLIAATVTDKVLTIILYSPDNTPLTGDDGTLLTFDVNLEGRSGSYALRPSDVVLSNATEENMVSATYSANVTIQSPQISGSSSLSFGEQAITETMTAYYTVRNVGKQPLTIDRVTFLAEGYSVATDLPTTIPAGGSDVLTINYVTAVAGAFSTTMNVYSNDPEQPMLAVAVTGTGFSPNELEISGKLVGDNNDFALVISLENNSELVAAQFDITVDDADAIDGAPTLVATSRLASHSSSITSMGDGVWRVLVYSMSNAAIDGSTGSLMTVTFPRSSDTYGQVTFTLTNVVLSDANGVNLLSPVLTLDQSCTLNVKRSQTITWEQDFGKVYEGDVISLEAVASSGLDIVYELEILSGDAEIIGSNLHILSVGSYIVTATQPGDDSWLEAEPVSKTINASTGVESIENDEEISTAIYTLQGVKVAHPQPGQIYILVTPTSTTKRIF
ncbi:MAG: DUF1573 domain-containing protein [Bacteroidales bacterium]|nr:DUF1573 domain-containing protein [Bacteroidales bacterium]